MGMVGYSLLGFLAVVVAGAALYDTLQNRQVRKSLPNALSRSGRRHAVREDELEQAHLQDMAYRQIPPAGFVNPYDLGGSGGA